MSKHLPVFEHKTMLTNYDVMLKANEIKILDDYVVSNNLTVMDLATFRHVVCSTFPSWRAEQVVGDFYHDDGGYSNYKKYITFSCD